MLLATLLKEIGDLDSAEAAYREAMERGIGIGAYNLGRLLEDQDRIEEAEAAFAAAEDLEEVEQAEMEAENREDDEDEDDDWDEPGLVPAR